MTSDLVERLRKLADRERPYGSLPDTLEEAAARIEQLEAALRYIAWGQKEGDEPHLIARAVLLDLPGVSEADVDVVWEPPWNPAMMTPAGRARVGGFRRDVEHERRF